MSESDKGKLATPANLLSLSRVAAVPFIIYLVIEADGDASPAATAIFVAAAVTDFLDGLFARSTGTVSELGKVLDPVADRILISGTIIALTISGMLPIIGVALVVARDISLILGYKAIDRRGIVVRVSLLGKTYTALFMFAILFIMAGVEPGGRDVGLWLFWISVVGSIVSGLSYLARAMVMIKARDVARTGRHPAE